MPLNLDCADELLTTTRAVRKRLDLTRPVPREVILDCVRIAQQAPTGSNRQTWRWVVVYDAAKRQALADLYHRAITDYVSVAQASGVTAPIDEDQAARISLSTSHLAAHLHEVPVLVVPCLLGRLPERPAPNHVGAFYASIYPAVWSFNLALRARGLGTVLTTVILAKEQELSQLLGIPADVTPTALLPVAYTIGDSFRPAARPPAETITFFDGWQG